MKITVNTRTIYFPTFLVVNRVTVGMICRWLKKQGILLTKKEFLFLSKELRLFQKQRGDWNLVEIQSQDKTKIQIKL